MASIVLVVEDDLSETVSRVLVDYAAADLEVQQAVVCSGFGQIKRRLLAYNAAAAIVPHFVLTDLDKDPCPSGLVAQWMGKKNKHPNLLLRVAVREVESWLMSDRDSFARLLGIAVNRVPAYPEKVRDAKAELIRLARTSPKRDVRRALVPIREASQGPDHNGCLCRFVLEEWRIDEAAANAASLHRAIAAVSGLS